MCFAISMATRKKHSRVDETSQSSQSSQSSQRTLFRFVDRNVGLYFINRSVLKTNWKSRSVCTKAWRKTLRPVRSVCFPFLIPPFTSLILRSVTVLLHAPPHFVLSSTPSESRADTVLCAVRHVHCESVGLFVEAWGYCHILTVPRNSITWRLTKWLKVEERIDTVSG